MSNELIPRLLNLQNVTSNVYVSKLLVCGPYIDEFMNRFECKRCGKCEEIGAVIVDWDDIRGMAAEIDINYHSFADKYTTKLNGRTILKQPCPFYKDNGCSIHSGRRAKVCRLFPLYTTLCTDGIFRIGVRSECEAAVEFLKKFEEEKLSYQPIAK